MKLVITCEHAFPNIPGEYAYLFALDPAVLETHEAYDPGSYDLFRHIAPLGDEIFYQKIGRLLVETNRSLWHTSLYSRFSRNLGEREKSKILNNYYRPYREMVTDAVASFIVRGNDVVHISVHSFTPVLNNIIRNADIGLLYDPARRPEKNLSSSWKKLLQSECPDLKIRYNYPYLGKADGFTTALRKKFQQNYVGIELEINQSWVNSNRMDSLVKDAIYKSIEAIKQKA